MKLKLPLLTVLALFSAGYISCHDGQDTNNMLVDCDDWLHPDPLTNLMTAADGQVYDIDENILLPLTELPEGDDLSGQPIWTEEQFRDAGYEGRNTGEVAVEIPDDGDYIIWITAFGFITPYQMPDGSDLIEAKRFTGGCPNNLNNIGFLRAVEFPLEMGTYNVQISHSLQDRAILRVTRTQP